jgi:ABC-type spermidine/putrescine transport system permease subunit II
LANRTKVNLRKWKRPAALTQVLRGAPALPLLSWAMLFILLPGIIMLVYSFWKYRNFNMYPEWNLSNYVEVFRQSAYPKVMVRTIWIAALTTLVTTVTAYPMSYFLARCTSTWRPVLLVLLMVPFWTSTLIRNYAWISILGQNGVINRLLLSLGLIHQPLTLLYTTGAVVTAAVYLYFPFAVLSIYSSLVKIGTDIEQAALDLGAIPFQVFRRITLPLSLAGVQAAVVFVFVPALGLFVTPQLLGGAKATMIGNLQVSLFQTLDFGLGSAVSMLLLVVVFLIFVILGRSLDLETVYGGGTGRQVGPAVQTGPRNWLFNGYATLVYLFLFAPIIVLVLFSFNRSPAASFPLDGFTLQWYRDLFHNAFMLSALRNSLIVAVATAALSVVLAAPAAYAVVRNQFPGRWLLRQLMILPMVVPPLMLGVGMLQLFSTTGITPSILTIITGHITYVVPYTFIMISAQQYGFDRRIEEAASDLGASPWGVAKRVVLPLMWPAILAAALFAFTLSLDEFIITFLLSGSTGTLPLYIWGQLRTGVSPEVNALGTLIVAAAILSLLVVQVFNRPTGRGVSPSHPKPGL